MMEKTQICDRCNSEGANLFNKMPLCAPCVAIVKTYREVHRRNLPPPPTVIAKPTSTSAFTKGKGR